MCGAHGQARGGLAILVLAPLLSCDIGTGLSTSEQSVTIGGLSCEGDRDCPQDMSCKAGHCGFGSRSLDAGADVDSGDLGTEVGDDDLQSHDGGTECASPTCEQLGRQCGTWADPCGGTITCDSCGPSESCSESGQCLCLLEACGDACCGAGEVCHDGVCCAPSCAGACCGDDGCGGSCPDRCADTGQVCGAGSCACEGACQPQECSALGKSCGTWADGCGGEVDCGGCGTNRRCNAAGLCECRHQSCGGACCAADQLCSAGVCCTPQCDGRSCGGDGCGGACGQCGSGETCTIEGACVLTAVCGDGTCDSPSESCATCPGDCCPTCDDDPHEPNDGAAQAVVIGGVPLEMPGLWLCNPSDDWWKVEGVEEGEDIQVEIDFHHADADLDLQVLDAQEGYLAASQGMIDGEKVQLYDLAAGDYLIRVFSFDHNDAVYDLRLDRPPPCVPDGYEPNEEQSQATSLGAVPVALTDLGLCANDRDWLSFSVPAGANVHVRLDHEEPIYSIYFTLFEHPSGQYLGSGHQDSTGQSARLYNLAAGEYAIQVSSGIPQNAAYTLRVETIDPCPNDGQEPNDTSETATSLTGGFPSGLTDLVLCQPEADWFALGPVGGGDPFSVTLATDDGDLQAEVFNAAGAYVTAANPNRTVEVHHQPAGDYFVKVRSYDSRYRSYDLSVDGAPACAQDTHEPNDHHDEAVEVSLPFSATGLTICNPDIDAFKVTATAGQRLIAELTYSRAGGELFLLAINAEGSWSTANSSGDDRVLLEADLEEAGDYYVEVRSSMDDSNSYDISIAVE